VTIAVDLVLATRPNASTGIERYAINLFEALRRIAPEAIAFVDSVPPCPPGRAWCGCRGLSRLAYPAAHPRLAGGAGQVGGLPRLSAQPAAAGHAQAGRPDHP
jgi:hypothetical protein